MIGDVKKKKKSTTSIGNAANYIAGFDFCFDPISFIPSTLGNNSASKLKSWAYLIMNVVIFYAALGQSKIS